MVVDEGLGWLREQLRSFRAVLLRPHGRLPVRCRRRVLRPDQRRKQNRIVAPLAVSTVIVVFVRESCLGEVTVG